VKKLLNRFRRGLHSVKFGARIRAESRAMARGPSLALSEEAIGRELHRLAIAFDPNPRFATWASPKHPCCSNMVKKAFDFILSRPLSSPAVLDVGAGPGNLGLMLMNRGFSDYEAVERWWPRVAWGKLLWKRFGKDYPVRNEDARAMSVSSECKDFVVLLDWEFENNPYPLILGECTRVLKRGGFLIFSYRDREEILAGPDRSMISSAISKSAVHSLCAELGLSPNSDERAEMNFDKQGTWPTHVIVAEKGENRIRVRPIDGSNPNGFSQA